MKNSLGRQIPEQIIGIDNNRLYEGLFSAIPQGRISGKTVRSGRPASSKVLSSLLEAVEKTGLQSGMTVSFHHHLRNGDYIIEMVMAAIAQKGLKDITIAASSLNPCHDFLIDYIEKGIVTAIETSGLRDTLGRYLTNNPGKLKKPVIIRSHGGRARAIECGEVKIDVAFMGASVCDRFGNASGRHGKSAFGAMGYAMVDSRFAEKVVMITDNLVDGYVYPYSIAQTDVDYVVQVEQIGDPRGIATGVIRMSDDPVTSLLAEHAVEFIEQSGYLKEGFSLQLGGGGASLTAARFIKEKMLKHNIKGGFGIGGATGIFTQMLTDGFFKVFYDTQTFDTVAAESLAVNPCHLEISASHYANPWNPGAIVNDLDVVILSATEVDLSFNVNCMTDSNGILMGASGGHSDTAAGAKLALIVLPLIRGRLPMIRDHVQTVVTPGESIDVVITDRGIAINPRRTDLLDKLAGSSLPLLRIEQLQQIAHELVGKPEEMVYSQEDKDIVAVIEYRDGSIIDVVRKPLV